MKIGVIGAGSWGSTMAKVLADSGHDVMLWVREADLLELLKKKRRSYFVKSLHLPDNVAVTNELNEALEYSSVLFNAVPVQYISSVFKNLDLTNKNIVNLSKGLELSTHRRPSQIFETFGAKTVSTLSGPSYAEEVAKEIPTSVVVAAKDIEFARFVRDLYNVNYFRVYSNDDLVGVEIAGAIKNVIAIAAGIIDGLGGWNNSKAALITRATVEMARLGVALGGKPETVAGLAGVGDLIVTCTGVYSRNRKVGEELAKKRKIDEILSSMKMVAEGVATCRAIYHLSRELNIELPIVEQVYAVLYKEKEPKKAIVELMTRKKKDER